MHAARREVGESVASCGPGYSKLRGVVGHHRLQVVVRGRLDDEALARVVPLEELGDVEQQ